jgi:hypothetical protein
MSMDMVLVRKTEAESEKGISWSVSFEGITEAGDVNIALHFRGDSDMVGRLLGNLGAGNLGDVIIIDIQRNKQAKLGGG